MRKNLKPIDETVIALALARFVLQVKTNECPVEEAMDDFMGVIDKIVGNHSV